MIRALLIASVLAGCSAAPGGTRPMIGPQGDPPPEVVAIPGTGFKFEMIYVPGGKFRMGSPDGEAGRDADEGPVREVEVRPFWISRTEVTVEEYMKFYDVKKQERVEGVTHPSKPYEPPHGSMETRGHPAVGMRWHGAMGYADWLSKLTGQHFRLPTEAEWEYAARAGAAAAAPEPLADYAWFAGNSNGKTRPIGARKPNAFGLHDMVGNVWEYCLEPFQPPEYGPVVRGGAWNAPAPDLRFANRQTIIESWYERDPNRPRSLWWLTDGQFIGFRVVRSADPGADAYVSKVEVRNVKMTGKSKYEGMARVSGEVVNAGNRALEEVEVLVHFLDEDGKPIFVDRKDRPSFSRCYPVLANSARDGEHRKPLAPGQARAFQVDVPRAYEWDSDLTQLAARVTALRFAKD
jgi:formylglycine-generating enzyme required for sulfatase activity